MEYEVGYSSAYESAASERAAFIRRTYAHLAGAILAFVGIEFVLVNSVDPQQLLALLARSPFSWLIVLGAFMVAGWVAEYWARSATSPALQYCGLGLYVVAESIIFLPILMLAANKFDGLGGPHYASSVIPTAGIMTLMVAGGLTASVFITKKDYSSLGPVLCVGGFIAMGLIIASIIFGFSLGLIFSFAMVALMSGYILYQTSLVLHYLRPDQHVAAALMLFASVATLFWYILQIVMSMSNRD